jgi:hypothetical protein
MGWKGNCEVEPLRSWWTVSSLQDDVVPHIITHSQHLRLGKFVSSGAKRVLQHRVMDGSSSPETDRIGSVI